MYEVKFDELYDNLRVPVIVCLHDEPLTVVYGNMTAMILAEPALLRSVEEARPPLGELIRFRRAGELLAIQQMISGLGHVDGYEAHIIADDGTPTLVTVMGNVSKLAGKDYCVFYLFSREMQETSEAYEDILFQMLNTSYHVPNVDEAIRTIIAIAGEYIGVSRVYIFEDMHNEYTRNTYEWCAAGVEPAIQDLQNLRKDEYVYDQIMDRSNLFICENINDLSEEQGRDVLTMQGIRALAILPMYLDDEPLGYVGFDDCEKERIWSRQTLQFLQSIATIITQLINRRNGESRLKLSYDVLQIITDSVDSTIYVNDLKTYELMFVNKAVLDLYKLPVNRLIGRKCYEVMQKGMTEPCSFCPLKKLVNDEGGIIANTCESELFNTLTGRWSLAKDSIIRWTDGSLAHIQNAVDITYHKHYEEQLHHYASTDIMTGTFNREWGYRLLEEAWEISRVSGAAYSLCFIDVDGLKITNDTFGHDAGDELLEKITSSIRVNVRKDDMLCRWGGDEFLLLMSCPPQNAQIVINKIKACLDAENAKKLIPYSLAFSYGITDFTAHDNIDAAVSEADQLMYADKMAKRQSS